MRCGPVMLALAMVAAAAAARATPPPPSETELRSLLAESARSGRPLLLYFSEAWCEPCRVVEAAMASDVGLQRAVDRFVFHKYDTSFGVGWQVSNRYRVNDIPTFVVVAADGRVLARRTGGGRELASWLTEQAVRAAQLNQQAAQHALIEWALFGVAIPLSTSPALAISPPGVPPPPAAR
jgi:thiol-disulfide isomerase/thioredoxin